MQRTRNGGEIQRRADGHLREVRTPNGAVIQHGLTGSRRVEVERADHSRIVAERGRRGYVQHPWMYHGHEFAHRTYYVHGMAYDHFYRRYEYRPGVFVEVYAPVRYYPEGFYYWASTPWTAPVTFRWGFVASPWYSYYGFYFTPAPIYPTASLWLTDYLISESLAIAYQAQPDAAAQMQAANAASAAALTLEVKNMIAAEVQQQLALENDEARQSARNTDIDPGSSGIARMLGDRATHIFVAGRELDLVDATGQECAISEGDVLQFKDAPAADARVARLLVLASKGSPECRPSATVLVEATDLQDMQNHMRETIDQGLADLQTGQGQAGLPALPSAARAQPVQPAFAAIAPPADPDAAQQISQQSSEADKAEQETVGQMQAPATDTPGTPATATPVTLTLGLTIDQITGMLGKPIRVFEGDNSKTVYFYKDMKITFTAGKVTDIE